MDKIDTNNIQPPEGENSIPPFIVTLDMRQYFGYQTYHIAIHAPDGRHLETIGKALKIEAAENLSFRLHEQVALVTCLLGNISDSVNMPMPAVLGLADLMSRLE